MTDINSPLGRFKIAQSSQPRKSYVVEDAEMEEEISHSKRPNLSHEEAQSFFNEAFSDSNIKGNMLSESNKISFKEIEQKRKNYSLNKERISPEAKKRIEILSGLGRIIDKCDLDGVTFTMQSLKTSEQKDIFASLFKGEDNDRISQHYKIRIETLARAVTHIDDQPFDLIVGSSDINIKKVLFEEMGDHSTDYLYSWYKNNIDKTASENYSKEKMEEVVEDIKK